MNSARRPHPIALVLVAVVAQALLVLAFVVPGHDPEPHELPVAVQGPPELTRQLQQRAGDAFELKTVTNGEQAVLDREAYGALIPQERTLLVASAASFPVSQLLTSAFADAAPTVRDIRPLDEDDPRGTVLNLMLIPLIVVCLPLGLLLAREGSRRTTAIASTAFAALAGLAVIAVTSGWLGVIPGDFLPLAGVAALLVGAVVLPAAGLVRLIGPAGLGVVALVVFFIGIPASGAASAPELLPGFWRAVGPLLPAGAGATALRNVAYFDGAAIAGPLLVLAAFCALGLALVAVSPRVDRQ